MKHKSNEYKAQFYKQNCGAFVVALAAALLIAALNLVISWVMQQMIDSVSGVSGSLSLSTLALCVAGLAAAVLVLKTAVYFSKPRFMERAVRQYKDTPLISSPKRAFPHLMRKAPQAISPPFPTMLPL